MRSRLFALALTFAFGTLAPAAQQTGLATAETLLGRGLHQEEVEGNLEGAIATYKKVIGDPRARRATVATALLHLGRCYETLGSSESRKAFERIAREFTDQAQVAAEARARLARSAPPPAPAATAPMALKKVWSGAKVDPDGTISPDGRSLSFVDWETGDLAIHDFATGANRRLTNSNAPFTPNSDFVEESAISRNGRQVAYSRFSAKDQRWSLWVVDFNGRSQPQQIFANDDVIWIGPYDWSPDGKWIAVQLQRKNRTNELGVVAPEDGSLRILKSRGALPSTKVLFSPDGKFLAFDVPMPDTRRPDVFVIGADGTREAHVVDNPASDYIMGWAPDGRRLLFISDRNGAKGLWSVPVANGKADGPPELVKRDVDGYPLGISDAGTLFFGLAAGDRDIRTGAIDFATGRLLKAPAAAADSYVGANQQPEWSPDGKSLAYVSGRDAVIGSNKVLMIRSLETGQVRQMPVKLEVFNWPHWWPDGRSFVSVGKDFKGRSGIFRIDADTGDATIIVDDDADHGSFGPDVSPDGKRVYFRRFTTGSDERAFIERDVASGSEREIFHSRGLGTPAVSPDGRHIATTASDASGSSLLLLVPIAGGEAAELFRAAEYSRGTIGSWVSWTPDGRSVIVNTRLNDREKDRQVWLVPISGGTPRKLDIVLTENVPVRVHPDGQHLAFVAGQVKWEVWALEHFLPSNLTTR